MQHNYINLLEMLLKLGKGEIAVNVLGVILAVSIRIYNLCFGCKCMHTDYTAC